MPQWAAAPRSVTPSAEILSTGSAWREVGSREGWPRLRRRCAVHCRGMNGLSHETSASRAIVLLRLAVGVVFLSEGLQKFLFAEAQGAGRFAKIGIPAPEAMGPFVGGVEIVCGVLVLAGLATRFAALPLALTMLTALASTKVPILLGHGYWRFAQTFAPKEGWWAFLHESRTDFSMLCAATFLAFVGGGAWSLDAWRMRRRERSLATGVLRRAHAQRDRR